MDFILGRKTRFRSHAVDREHEGVQRSADGGPERRGCSGQSRFRKHPAIPRSQLSHNGVPPVLEIGRGGTNIHRRIARRRERARFEPVQKVSDLLRRLVELLVEFGASGMKFPEPPRMLVTLIEFIAQRSENEAMPIFDGWSLHNLDGADSVVTQPKTARRASGLLEPLPLLLAPVRIQAVWRQDGNQQRRAFDLPIDPVAEYIGTAQFRVAPDPDLCISIELLETIAQPFFEIIDPAFRIIGMRVTDEDIVLEARNMRHGRGSI